ncbi:MAG: Rne/Rng family ribonuclease, partial [bacterium]
MQEKKILISVDGEESRIALIDDGELENLHIELIQKGRIVGNIYKGVVTNIQSAFQAAFVDYGAERKGFLSISDVNLTLYKPSLSRPSHGKPPIQTVLKHGQSLMVQVVKEQIGHKGAALTTNISLPGRFLVFMPNSDKGGISKKIENEEQRNRLKDLLKGLENENAAIIVRTAGIDRSLAELKKDYRTLLSRWRKIQVQFKRMSHPGMIYEEQNMVVRTLRDYFTHDIQEVLVNDANAFQQALELFKEVMPRQQKKLRLFVGDQPLFSAYGIEKQIEQLSDNKVPLKSGGSIIIDTTEALVAIDVNSGASKQENKIEETALRTNLEAATEIARQLRLRNLGGLIVIDFIDMDLQRNRKKVVQTLEESLSSDKAKCIVDTISQFGLLEMSRQRIGSELSYKIETVCPTCQGKGSIPSVITSANIILRRIRELAAKGNLMQVSAELPLDLANYLLNEKRDCLRELEQEFDITIQLTANLSAIPGLIPKLDIKLIGPTADEKEADIKEPIVAKKDTQKNHFKKKENDRKIKETNGYKKKTYNTIIDNYDKEDISENKGKENVEIAEDLPLSPSPVIVVDQNDFTDKEENIEEKDLKDDNKSKQESREESRRPFARVRAKSWFRARFGSKKPKEEEKKNDQKPSPLAELFSLGNKTQKPPTSRAEENSNKREEKTAWHEQKLNKPENVIARHEEKLHKPEEKIDRHRHEEKIARHEQKIDKPENVIARHEEKLHKPEEKIDRHEEKIARHEQKIDKPENVIARHEEKLIKPEEKIDRHRH